MKIGTVVQPLDGGPTGMVIFLTDNRKYADIKFWVQEREQFVTERFPVEGLEGREVKK